MATHADQIMQNLTQACPAPPSGADSAADGARLICRVEKTDSVFSVARRLQAAGIFPEYASVFADVQSEGRGQYGRSWQSARGNIHAAIRLPMRGIFLTGASACAAAVLTAEALRREGYAAKIKWPNDIVCETPAGPVKTGGILIEERGDMLTAGIGINVCWAPEPSALRSAAALPAGRLSEGPDAADPYVLWERIAEAFRSADPNVPEAAWLRRAEALLLWLGEDVSLALPGGEKLEGRILGLAPGGELLLALPDGTQRAADRGSLSAPSARTEPRN